MNSMMLDESPVPDMNLGSNVLSPVELISPIPYSGVPRTRTRSSTSARVNRVGVVLNPYCSRR